MTMLSSPPPNHAPVPTVASEAPPLVEAVNLSKRFGALQALKDVSITIRPGTFRALLGENGAGKSTLVKCIMGTYQADTGTVRVGAQQAELKTPRQAVVTVPILPGPVERTLVDQPVRLRSLGAGLVGTAMPSGISIILRGSKEGLSRIKADNIVAYVDLAGLGVGDYSLGVQVDAPHEAGVARIIPATVQITIARAKP